MRQKIFGSIEDALGEAEREEEGAAAQYVVDEQEKEEYRAYIMRRLGMKEEEISNAVLNFYRRQRTEVPEKWTSVERERLKEHMYDVCRVIDKYVMYVMSEKPLDEHNPEENIAYLVEVMQWGVERDTITRWVVAAAQNAHVPRFLTALYTMLDEAEKEVAASLKGR